MKTEDGHEIEGGGIIVWLGVAVVLATMFASCSMARADEVSVTPAENGLGAMFSFDLGDPNKWQRVLEKPWYRFIDSAATEFLLIPAWRNKGKIAGGTILAVGGYRLAEGKLDDDFRDIAESLGLRDEDEPRTPDPVEQATGFGVTTYGDNSPVALETDSTDVQVATYGDNSPINVSEPQPLPVAGGGE